MLSKFTQVCYSHSIYSKKKKVLKKMLHYIESKLVIYFLLKALLLQMVSWALSV